MTVNFPTGTIDYALQCTLKIEVGMSFLGVSEESGKVKRGGEVSSDLVVQLDGARGGAY